MEASTSKDVSSNTAANTFIRERPDIQVAPNGPPPGYPPLVMFYHPANDRRFLSLPAYDCCPPTFGFGIHYGTAVTACQILACNEKGYLSTSRDRDAAGGRVNGDWDDVVPSGRYYYHLDTQLLEGEELYPICTDFSVWKFPHDLPEAWKYDPPLEPTEVCSSVWPSNWTAVSRKVINQDEECFVSKWRESLSAAQVVPGEQEEWLDKNSMFQYLLGHAEPLHRDRRNLFTLRLDLQLGQFDEGRFVIVPKCGKLVVHFLKRAGESAREYHNVGFDDKDSRVSRELLYARFAWGLMRGFEYAPLGSEKFNLVCFGEEMWDGGAVDEGGGDQGGGGGSRGRGRGVGKRKRKRNYADVSSRSSNLRNRKQKR